MMLTVERLKSLLHYDPETGIFTNLVRRSDRALPGTRAGGVNHVANNGYRHIKIDTVMYCEHRLAWFYMTGEWPEGPLDHINRERTDNRWANLRESDASGQMQNTRKRKDNTSGHRGVHWSKEFGRWVASISVNKKRRWLGIYDELEDAIAAYDKAKAELHPFQPVAVAA